MHAQQMAGHLIRRLHQVSSQVFATQTQAAGFRMTAVQFAAMDAIQSNPGADQAQIASLISYDRATIGGVIDRLEKKGLVAREVSSSDRRAREVRLTRQGEKTFTPLLAVVQALQGDILGGLDDAEKEHFLTLATKAMASNDSGKSS